MENFGIAGVVAATDKMKHDDTEKIAEGLIREEEDQTGNAEANRVLKVLMVNFGASIR